MGSGWRNASSPCAGTSSNPSGFATALATLARNLVRAMPTVMGRPTSLATRARNVRPISTGAPRMRRSPATSRNASSTEMPSTSGVVSWKIANTRRLASVYAANRGGTTITVGQSLRAALPPMGVEMPNAFAS